VSAAERWPALPLAEWEDTRATLHVWMQIVGKVRLALAPMENHWWQVALYVNARGLTTSAMPFAGGVVELTFDFQEHVLRVETSSGASRTIALAPRSVADFYHEVLTTLRDVGVDARITRLPSEMENAIPFDEDETHSAYDRDSARLLWRVLLDVDRILHEFRGRFIGKCSPVHFWWGGFDMAVTRFSGREAPPHPGGIPNLPDWVTREAYSHECMSVGWWPGGGAVSEPAFYAYAYPEPAGCPTAPISPAAAYYHGELREWILPYDAVRAAADPDADVMAFLQSAYDTVARLGKWDPALERSTPETS
jgi:hypothetical protein